ncbi:MAG: LLM class flavin-dependent oxidoreductase [Chloroflexi bacterium]|nr:LLM class flavin-dependent oxidoreductase [Chloroflexota bacterium]
MTYRPARMKFGTFIAPFHRVGENPTLAMKRDMALIEHLDRLGFDEAWIGEHHSFGRELIADPAVFIAAAAERTRKIKLGTGVTSLPYHHPLITADKMLQLDHMTEGRAMLGCGPGALTSDAYMMGIDPVTQRRRMNEALDAIIALFEAKGPVTMTTDWFTLREARLQMASYTQPHLPIAVAATFTPSGPTAAGKHGLGLLSVAGADNEGFARTWKWMEEAAAESGKCVDRGEWRVVVPIHLADSKQEAIEDIREGYRRRAYVGDRLDPSAPAAGALFGAATGAATIEESVESGAIIAGTPDDAITQIDGILDRSGGLGGILGFSHEWASTEKTWRSYELLARYVAPRFQGQLPTIEANRNWIEGNLGTVFGTLDSAFQKAFEDSGKPIPEQIQKGLDAMRNAREAANAKR